MDGSMSGVDPDQVENETGIFWRTLYKLEKGFQDNPNPLKMAKKVRSLLQEILHALYYMNPVGFIYRIGTDVQCTAGITGVFK